MVSRAVAGTVIMPVNNGASLLGATLRQLLTEISANEVRTIVVCNGCTDDSVHIARAWADRFLRAGKKLIVIELAERSRAKALNTAEPHAEGTRIYLDHDVLLSAGSLGAVLGAIRSGYHFVTLRPSVRGPLGLAVSLYFRLWVRLPYVCNSPATMGFYAVSQSGRQRWDLFPQLHSDDKFSRLHFMPRERIRLDRYFYSVAAPLSMRELVQARTRYDYGNLELRRKFPDLLRRDVPRFDGIVAMALEPSLWPSLFVAAYVHGLARFGLNIYSSRRRAKWLAPPS